MRKTHNKMKLHSFIDFYTSDVFDVDYYDILMEFEQHIKPLTYRVTWFFIPWNTCLISTNLESVIDHISIKLGKSLQVQSKKFAQMSKNIFSALVPVWCIAHWYDLDKVIIFKHLAVSMQQIICNLLSSAFGTVQSSQHLQSKYLLYTISKINEISWISS